MENFKVRDTVEFINNPIHKGFIYSIDDKYVIVNWQGNELTYTLENFKLTWKKKA